MFGRGKFHCLCVLLECPARGQSEEAVGVWEYRTQTALSGKVGSSTAQLPSVTVRGHVFETASLLLPF